MGRSQDALEAWHNATILKPTHWNSWNNAVILLDNLSMSNLLTKVPYFKKTTPYLFSSIKKSIIPLELLFKITKHVK